MGNANVVPFEAQVMSAVQALNVDRGKESNTPKPSSENVGVLTSDGDGGATKQQPPVIGSTGHKLGVTRTRADPLAGLESVADGTSPVSLKKRKRAAWAPVDHTEGCVECSMCDFRKTEDTVMPKGIVVAGAECAAKKSTNVVTRAVSDLVEGEPNIQPDGLVTLS